MNGRWTKITLAAVVVCGFVYLGRGYFDQLHRIKDANWYGVLAMALIHTLSLWLHGLSLKQGLAPFGPRIRGSEGFCLSVMGAYSNLLVPRAAVGVAAMYLKRVRDIPLINYGAVVLFNAALFVLVCSLTGIMVVLAQWRLGGHAPPSLLAFGLPALALISTAIVLVPWRLPRGYSSIGARFFEKLSRANSRLGTSRYFPQLILLHAVMMLARALRLAVAFWALGIEVNLLGVLMASVLSDLAFAVSITPAALGFREAAIALAATSLGTTPALALSAALFDRLVFSLTAIVLAQVVLTQFIRKRRAEGLGSHRQARAKRCKRIVFIATREPTYSRVSIVRRALEQHYDVESITCSHPRYAIRFLVVVAKIVWWSVSGRLRKADAICVGFLAQPVFPLVRWLYRGPIVADAYFSLFDTLVHDKQKARPGSWLARICFRLDYFMLHRAELCLTDTQCHVDYFRHTFSAKQSRIVRLLIGAENPQLRHQAPAPQPNEPFQIFFWGGFIPLQGADVIVRAAGLLKEDNVRFTIYGNGQDFDRCQCLGRELGLTNINFAGWQSAERIQSFAEQAHVALGIFGVTDKAGRVIANKVFEAMAMGLPLITRTSPAIDELLQDDFDVMLVPPGNPEILAERIRWCREHYEAALEIGRNGQSTFQRAASLPQLAQTLRTGIDSLWGGSSTNRLGDEVPCSPEPAVVGRPTESDILGT